MVPMSSVSGAGCKLGYQYTRLECQAMDSGSSLHEGIDISFVAGKKNREGSKTTFGRLLLIDDGEYL